MEQAHDIYRGLSNCYELRDSYALDNWRSTLGTERNLSFRHIVYTDSGAHPTTHVVHTLTK